VKNKKGTLRAALKIKADLNVPLAGRTCSCPKKVFFVLAGAPLRCARQNAHNRVASLHGSIIDVWQ
jgi:hypothetical protein